MNQPLKTAVLLTGAAARISQEVAMFDQLCLQKGLKVSQEDTLLAGFSSGSLNLAAINACFANGSQLNWDTYYKQEVLFKLRNSDVYIIDELPFDTKPLRVTVQKFVDRMNCKIVGDLPFNSSILTFSYRELKTLWACSRNEGQQHINITDMFMASTAIPIVFPWQQIHCEPGYQMDFPDGHFADGGTGGAFKRFDSSIGEYVRNNGQFDNMYIISPMREKSQSVHKAFLELANANNHKGADMSELLEHLKNISMSTFMKFLDELYSWKYNGLPMAKNIFISIPEMPENFPIIDFDVQEKQYNAVTDWVKNNPSKLAVPIEQFINEHQDLA